MVTAFQILLIVVMFLAVIYLVSERIQDKQLQATVAGMFFASVAAFIVTLVWI